jgi:hypothetical protein
MLEIGFTPMAMLWRPETQSQMKYAPEESWKTFQRRWARPALIHGYMAVPPRTVVERRRHKAAVAAHRADAKDRHNSAQEDGLKLLIMATAISTVLVPPAGRRRMR